MFKTIVANLLNLDPTFTVSRSPQWDDIRKQFIMENGAKCACCHKKKELNVHHIIPVHVEPTLELEKSNLIILCENKTLNCHLVIGHLGNYRAYNPHVTIDAEFWYNRIKNRKYKENN